MSSSPNRLRPYLHRAGMTQQQLARAAQVSPEWISKIAHGKAIFSEATQRRIIRVLELDSDEANDAFGFPGARFRRHENGQRDHLKLVRSERR